MRGEEVYKPGELRFGTWKEYDVDDESTWDFPAHFRFERNGLTFAAWLPHSCDEWMIGDRKSIEALIADLQKALEEAP